MLPGMQEWLAESWADYRRRWLPLMTVLAVGGVATAAAVFLPLIPAGLAQFAGAGSPWAIWGAACSVSFLAGLWLSTWTQAASMRAAGVDESPAASLGAGWRQTPAFGWVLSLVMLAAGGGFVLLGVPGLMLTVLLFFAPFYQLAGEDEGMAAVELSFARVRPFFGPVALRLAVAALIAWLPSWIPYAGWLIGPLWAPFGLTACARLAGDLKTLTPSPERRPLGRAVGALSFVLVAVLFAASWAASRGAMTLYDSYASGRMRLQPPDAETAQALLAVLQGQGTDDDRRRASAYALSLSSAAAAAP